MSAPPHPSIVWFRQDLRLADNPALTAAWQRGATVIPAFIWAPEEEGDWPPGGASKWWLHESLLTLAAELKARGSRLIIRTGPSQETLQQLAVETGAGAVFWNRRYEPVVRERDGRIKEALRSLGLHAESFNAALLHEPWTIRNQQRRPFQVFTPFWRHCLSLPEPAAPAQVPASLPAPKSWPKSLALTKLGLEPKPYWAGGLRSAWRPGASGAADALDRFVSVAFDNYGDTRNRPDLPGTSRLSPHLHFGEISPRQIWGALKQAAQRKGRAAAEWHSSQFLAELGWREFAHHLLYHFPDTPTEPLREDFRRFGWHTNAVFFRAWQRGKTGYPFVDAGMRELWRTGWMHNRVRMVVASFLVKDLLISWREGAAWFWDTLVDADLAQNTLGWQWTAGCGADAAPYFRVFNPTTQGEKFDPQAAYIRRWVPELASLPDGWIHKPHLAPADVLARARVRLGEDYPHPIVAHAAAREVALAAYSRLRDDK